MWTDVGNFNTGSNNKHRCRRAVEARYSFFSTVMPWEAWYYGRVQNPAEASHFKWTYFWFRHRRVLSTLPFSMVFDQIHKKVRRNVPNDCDGNAIRAVLKPRIGKSRLYGDDPGALRNRYVRFFQQIALFKSKVLRSSTFPIPPDFGSVFWRQAAQTGLHRQIKNHPIAKRGLFLDLLKYWDR